MSSMIPPSICAIISRESHWTRAQVSAQFEAGSQTPPCIRSLLCFGTLGVATRRSARAGQMGHACATELRNVSSMVVVCMYITTNLALPRSLALGHRLQPAMRQECGGCSHEVVHRSCCSPSQRTRRGPHRPLSVWPLQDSLLLQGAVTLACALALVLIPDSRRAFRKARLSCRQVAGLTVLFFYF